MTDQNPANPVHRITLQVRSVVGTGDPMDVIGLTPLIASWGVPLPCVFCHGEGKTVKDDTPPISRLLILVKPYQGHKVVGSCARHFKTHVELAFLKVRHIPGELSATCIIERKIPTLCGITVETDGELGGGEKEVNCEECLRRDAMAEEEINRRKETGL